MPQKNNEEDDNYNFENEVEKQEGINIMQRAYFELAKYIFIPFLYGFDLNSVVNCTNYDTV